MWNFNNANNALPICPSEIHKLFWEELLSDALLFAKAFNFKCQACRSSRFEVKTNNTTSLLLCNTQTGERQAFDIMVSTIIS